MTGATGVLRRCLRQAYWDPTKPISKPDNPLRDDALEEADTKLGGPPYVDADGRLPDRYRRWRRPFPTVINL